MYVMSLELQNVLLVVVGFVNWQGGFSVCNMYAMCHIRVYLLLLLLLTLFGSCAVSESDSFDKHFYHLSLLQFSPDAEKNKDGCCSVLPGDLVLFFNGSSSESSVTLLLLLLSIFPILF